VSSIIGKKKILGSANNLDAEKVHLQMDSSTGETEIPRFAGLDTLSRCEASEQALLVVNSQR
jgi:hypothetical protein